MIICVCHRVSHHDIARAVREGCASFEELQFELQVKVLKTAEENGRASASLLQMS